MKIHIKKKNGSGWNHYAALRGTRLLKLLTVNRLAAKNFLTSILIEPYNNDKPLGIAARFFRDDPNAEERFDDQGDDTFLLFTLRFDQHATADDIAFGIKRLLSEGISTRIELNRVRLHFKAMADAKSAGFDTIEAHVASIEAAKAAEIAAALTKRNARLVDAPLAAEAFAELTALLSAHPLTLRITRRGELVGPLESKIGARFTHFDGMKSWLHQHGLRASVDDRHHFFAAAKAPKSS